MPPALWPQVQHWPVQPDLRAGRCQTPPAWLPGDAWTSPDPAVREAATWLCRSCPVLSSCRTWALTLPDSYAGIVGGLTRRDRKQAREARTARDEAVARIGRTPQRSRVVRALLADPRRSNRVIAASTTVQADHSTVRAVRHEMEAAGLIQPYRAPYGPGPRRRRTPLQERARAALLADAARSNRVVAEQLGMTSHARVQAMRHQLERDDLIPVYRAPYGPYGTMGACR